MLFFDLVTTWFCFIILTYNIVRRAGFFFERRFIVAALFFIIKLLFFFLQEVLNQLIVMPLPDLLTIARHPFPGKKKTK